MSNQPQTQTLCHTLALFDSLRLARRFVIGVTVITGYAGGARAVVGLLNKRGGHEDAR